MVLVPVQLPCILKYAISGLPGAGISCLFRDAAGVSVLEITGWSFK